MKKTFENEIYKHIEYHISSRNNKIFFENKSEHLKHYNEQIVNIQNQKYKNDVSKTIDLVKPLKFESSLEDTLINRKSCRKFSNYRLSINEISTILYYGTGYNENRKFTPTSGGFNSVEIFPIILKSDDVEHGIYHYSAENNCLETIHIGDFDSWLKNDIFYQKEFGDSSMVLVLASDIGRLSKKYHLRSYQLGILDVGHVSQNIYLTATALGLNISASGGYIEKDIEVAIGIDGFNIMSFLTLNIGKSDD